MLTTDDHARPRFGHACTRIRRPVDAAPAFPTNADAADRSLRVARLVDSQAALAGLEQRRSDALPFASRYRLAFETELESGRHIVQLEQDADRRSVRLAMLS
jgi:hypothetical protein